MARGNRGGAKRGGAAGRAPPRNNADEAIDDARAEIEDTTAVLDAGARLRVLANQQVLLQENCHLHWTKQKQTQTRQSKRRK